MKIEEQRGTLVPESVRVAIEHVISHFWDEAYGDYRDGTDEERAEHVFESLHEVRNWLESMDEAEQSSTTIQTVRGEGWSL